MNMQRYNLKWLAFVMATLICLTVPLMALAAADSSSGQTTASDHAIEFLISIGVINGGNSDEFFSFFGDEGLTRGEFAQLLCNMINLANTGYTETPYLDVPETHPYAEAIAQMTQMEVFAGGSDGNFYPDEPLYYEAAVKGIISVLGYRVIAELNGGYPAGYYHVARRLGLLNGSTIAEGTEITRGEVAQMMKNATETEILVPIRQGDQVRYESKEGQNYLTYYWGYEKVKGQITATETTHLTSSEPLPQGTVQIDDIIYDLKSKTINTAGVLGEWVTAYYEKSDDSSRRRLITLEREEGRSQRLTITGEDVTGFDESTRELVYERQNGRGSARVIISPSASIIYNGRYESTYTKEMLTEVNGTIDLVRTGNAKGYDLVKITDYEVYAVSGVSKVNKQIYNHYNPADIISVNDQDSEMRISITNEGFAVGVEDIKEWDIVEVARSVDKKVVSVVVTRNAVSGTVQGVSDSGENTIVTIDGLKYEVWDGVYDMPNPPQKLAIGTVGNFYINREGKIAAWSKESLGTSKQFGLVINAVKSESFDSNVMLKLLNEASEMVVLNCSTRLRVNGEQLNSSQTDELISMLKAPIGDTGDFRKIVRYRLNSNGEIAELEIAAATVESDADQFAITHVLTNQPYMSSPIPGFFGSVLMGVDTVAFVMPPVSKMNEMESYYATAARTYFSSNTRYNATVYSTMPSNIYADAVSVVRDNSNASTSRTDDVVIVESIAQTVDEDGNLCPSLEGISNGSPVSFVLENDEVWQNAYSPYGGTSPDPDNPYVVKRGDVVRTASNAQGKIAMIQIILRAEENDLVGVTDGSGGKHYGDTVATSYGSQNRFLLGYVYDLAGSMFSVVPTESKTPIRYVDMPVRPQNAEFYDYSSAIVYRITMENGKTWLEREESPEIVPVRNKTNNPTRIFVYAYNGSAKTILLIDDLR